PFSEELYAASYVPGRAIHLPFLHQRTHSIPVAALHFRSHHTELLELYTHFVSHAATALGIPISRVIPLPTQRTLWTVPKSPFVHKKSQENFERKVHKRLIKAWDADQEVVDRWLQYVQKHGIGGVGIRIVRWDRVAVGVGKRRLEDVSGEMDVRAEIRALGDRIVQGTS
ncbi:ribosomal protein S10 domain-containing protein, partial [Amanita rubescens]